MMMKLLGRSLPLSSLRKSHEDKKKHGGLDNGLILWAASLVAQKDRVAPPLSSQRA